MEVSILVGKFPISFNIEESLNSMLKNLDLSMLNSMIKL
jgi:hypothetical protein